MLEISNPSEWTREDLKKYWLQWIDTLENTPVRYEEKEIILPKKRIILQAESNVEAKYIFQHWNSFNANEKIKKWKRLMDITVSEMSNVLLFCVQCGECCKKGSPVLYLEDLELLRLERIPWSKVFTIRKGEPVTKPEDGRVSYLIDERIKIKEKPGSKECVFWDSTTYLCTIYEDRPLQCRAQACWDMKSYEELKDQPYLTRRDLFSHIEVLWDLIAEHNRRCSFETLNSLVRKLETSVASESVATSVASPQGGHDNPVEVSSKIIELVSYEEHFRTFVAEQLNIPEIILDLVFGRPLKALLEIFGLEIYIEGDTKYLRRKAGD